MNTSSSKRPRRSFATGSAPVSSPDPADVLRYDGDNVPVLIRLPDLSPQAQLHEVAAPPAPQLATGTVENPGAAEKGSNEQRPVEQNVVEQNTSPVQDRPDALASSVNAAQTKASAAAAQTTSDKPASNDQPVAPSTGATEPTVKSPNDRPEVDQSEVDQFAAKASSPTASNADSTPSTGEGSQKQKRRRRRSGRQHRGEQTDQVQLASPGKQRGNQRGDRRSTTTATVAQKEQNILSFDKSRLLIGVGLVVVAGMTYFALSGGDDAVDQTEPWQAGSQSAVVQTPEEQTDPEVDLWPSEQLSQDDSNSQPQTQIQPQQTPAGDANLAAGPVWSTGDEAGQVANPLDANGMPAADYSFNGPEITAPANGTGYVVPSDEGSTSGWPAETTPSAPVTGWPDDSTDTAPSSPGRVYESQPAGYTAPVAGPDTYGQAPVRTGSLDAATYSTNNVAAPTTSGSQLNGTIDIPRPRANNEYNGSSIY